MKKAGINVRNVRLKWIFARKYVCLELSSIKTSLLKMYHCYLYDKTRTFFKVK